MDTQNKQGSITCVGLGMTLGAHISPISRNHIETADVVFTGVSNHLVELWVKEMNPDVRSLQPLYQEGKDRRITYREMVDVMMEEVRKGKNVVGAFYGHPGIFAWSPHKVIETAKKEGFNAHMEPGVSAEDCLYADLGIDPGKRGSQHYEASHLMFYNINIEPTAYLILWQVGIAGDGSAAKFATGEMHRKVLVEVLSNTYPPQHEVVLYECPTLAIDNPRIEWVKLSELPKKQVSQHTTLVIPPLGTPQKNKYITQRLAKLNNKTI